MINYEFRLKGIKPYHLNNPIRTVEAESLKMAMALLAEDFKAELEADHYAVNRQGYGVWNITIDQVKICTFTWEEGEPPMQVSRKTLLTIRGQANRLLKITDEMMEGNQIGDTHTESSHAEVEALITTASLEIGMKALTLCTQKHIDWRADNAVFKQ